MKAKATMIWSGHGVRRSGVMRCESQRLPVCRSGHTSLRRVPESHRTRIGTPPYLIFSRGTGTRAFWFVIARLHTAKCMHMLEIWAVYESNIYQSQVTEGTALGRSARGKD